MPRRMITRTWRNGRGGRWDCRIRWYDDDDEGDNIRLNMEDHERRINYYPKDREEAEKVWLMFKQGCPKPGTNQPFVKELLDMLRSQP